MNIEGNSGIQARAVKHLALSDAARLRIVDLLTVGDASPGELRELLGMPSNLLAHHLRALEAAGMVSRHRSEADKRRSYVSLRPGALDGITPGAVARAPRVVFVCTANTARSQLASALWQQASGIPVASAGTHPADRIAPGAIAAARRHGLELPDAAPRALDEVVLPEDFVVTVCDLAHEELGDLGGAHWSIPDPVKTGSKAAFETAYTQIEKRIHELAPRLLAA